MTPGTNLDPDEALRRLAKFEELKKKAAKENQGDFSPVKNPQKLRRKSSFDISDILKLSKENNFGLSLNKIDEEGDGDSEDGQVEARNSGFSLDRRKKKRSTKKQTIVAKMSQFRNRNATMYEK